MKSYTAIGLLSRVLVAGLLSHTGSTIAGANIVLFDNYIQPGYGENPSAGWAIDSPSGLMFAMSFTPGVDTRFESLTLTVDSPLGTANVFDVKLHEESGGLPGPDLESFHLVGVFPSIGAPPTVIDSISRPILSAGSKYWVSVQAIPASPFSRGGWHWALGNDLASPDDGRIAWLRNDTPGWTIYPFSAPMGVFRVEGSPLVPEPGTLALVGGGLLVLLRRHRQG